MRANGPMRQIECALHNSPLLSAYDPEFFAIYAAERPLGRSAARAGLMREGRNPTRNVGKLNLRGGRGKSGALR